MVFLKKLSESEKNEEGKIQKKIIDESIENQEEVNDNPIQSRNFKYLDDLIHKGVKEIVLDSDIILDDEEESEYRGGIELDVDGLVIDGNGYCIDAKGKTIIFYCTGKKITIKNIILKNGFGLCAGAIFNNGELTITETTIHKNASRKKGGSIYNGGKLTITESTITGNKAELGGAIYNNGHGEIAIIKSTLDQNTAGQDGGAIDNNGQITIIESRLNKNVSWMGGAINNFNGNLIITESVLSGNTANHKAGAIFNSAMLILRESIINQHTSDCEIITNMMDFKVFSCEFSNNESVCIKNQDSLQIFDSNFLDNNCQYIIDSVGDLSNLSISKGKFKDNNVGVTIIFNRGKSCTIEKTIFEKYNSNDIIINECDLILINPKIKDEGKTIFNKKYVLIRMSQDELKNKVYGDGIVENEDQFKYEIFDFGYLDKKIRESTTKEIILEEDIFFKNYESYFYEGGIELDIDDLIIDGNGHNIDSNGKSRIFYCTGINITLKNITFKNGHSHHSPDNLLNSNGGAIIIKKNANVIMENCKFINNQSEENGGAIYNTGRLTMTDSTLTGNTAELHGGAICNWEGVVSITKCEFFDNHSGRGGRIIFNYVGEFTVDGNPFSHNIEVYTGGNVVEVKSKDSMDDMFILRYM